MKILRERLFLFVAFFLGTWGAVYNTAFTIAIFLSLLVNIWKDFPVYYENLKKKRFYVGLPLLFIIYILVHAWIYPFFKEEVVKPYYGTIESLVFFFLLIFLYVLSLKNFLTAKLLKQFLLLFCLGVFTFNIAAIMQLKGWEIISDTPNALSDLYENRFYGNREILGGVVYLEAQALYIATAAIISYFLMIIEKNKMMKTLNILLFFSFLFFLSITVTKASIIGFIVAFLFFNIVLFWNISLKYRTALIIGFVLAGSVVSVVLSDMYASRIEEAKQEINDVMNDNLQGGMTITPRYSLIKACMERVDEFSVFGLGVYSKNATKKWYASSSNHIINGFVHSHNSFLQYWLIGGVFGLFFILYLFFKPIWGMIRNKKYCFFILTLILLFFIPNNTCVLLVFSDSTSFIVLFLAMFYFYRQQFQELEDLWRRV